MLDPASRGCILLPQPTPTLGSGVHSLEPPAAGPAVPPLVCGPCPLPLSCPVVRCFSFLRAFQQGPAGQRRGFDSCRPVFAKSELPFRGGCLCPLTCSLSLGTQKGDMCPFLGGKRPSVFSQGPSHPDSAASQCQVASLSHASSPGLRLSERLKGGRGGAGSAESLLGLWGGGKRGMGEACLGLEAARTVLSEGTVLSSCRLEHRPTSRFRTNWLISLRVQNSGILV